MIHCDSATTTHSHDNQSSPSAVAAAAVCFHRAALQVSDRQAIRSLGAYVSKIDSRKLHWRSARAPRRREDKMRWPPGKAAISGSLALSDLHERASGLDGTVPSANAIG